MRYKCNIAFITIEHSFLEELGFSSYHVIKYNKFGRLAKCGQTICDSKNGIRIPLTLKKAQKIRLEEMKKFGL